LRRNGSMHGLTRQRIPRGRVTLQSCTLGRSIHHWQQSERQSYRSTDLAKAKKVGRPKLPKGEAKGRIVPVRFTAEDLKALETAAKAKDQTVSEWIRSTVSAKLNA